MFRIFAKHSNVVAAISISEDGNMRIKSLGSLDQDRLIVANRRNFFNRIGLKKAAIIAPILSHGINVKIVGSADAATVVPDTDALVTNEIGIFLTLTVADCLPIFLYDSRKQIIGLIHAGWRGLAQDIVEQVVKIFQHHYGSSLADIMAGIGPSICRLHYEVGKEVSTEFSDYPEAVTERDGRILLDLPLVARLKLIRSGLPPNNVETSSECTFELPDKYFSYRRDKPQSVEAMVVVFGMTSKPG